MVKKSLQYLQKEILRNIFYTVQKSQFHALISQEENNLKI